MARWPRRIVAVGDRRVVLALGVLNVLSAVDRLLLGVTAAQPLDETLPNVVLLAGAGVVLLYWGATLPRRDLDSAASPRIAGWSVAGAALLLLVVVFLSLDPGDSILPSREIVEIAVAVGSVGGYIIGRNEARAVTRAREAERHRKELEANQAQLRRQNDRLESFAGMLAHELRNPLQIARIYHPRERARNEDAAAQVERAIERIDEMVDILLVIVRGSEVTIDYEPVVIADVAADAWADLSAEVAAAELVLDVDRVIRADPVHVEHLLRNLFRNSLEHGDEDATIRVGDLDGGFYVEDDGPGIPEERWDDVTQAGFTTKDDGIGLGLTFVDQLADKYGWRWNVADSEIGGVRFEFTDVELVSTAAERRPS